MNECLQTPNPCPSNTICLNTVGSYACVLAPTFPSNFSSAPLFTRQTESSYLFDPIGGQTVVLAINRGNFTSIASAACGTAANPRQYACSPFVLRDSSSFYCTLPSPTITTGLQLTVQVCSSFGELVAATFAQLCSR